MGNLSENAKEKNWKVDKHWELGGVVMQSQIVNDPNDSWLYLQAIAFRPFLLYRIGGP